jgi:hypothetical protein
LCGEPVVQRLRDIDLDPDRDPETGLADVKIGGGQQLADGEGIGWLAKTTAPGGEAGARRRPTRSS